MTQALGADWPVIDGICVPEFDLEERIRRHPGVIRGLIRPSRVEGVGSDTSPEKLPTFQRHDNERVRSGRTGSVPGLAAAGSTRDLRRLDLEVHQVGGRRRAERRPRRHIPDWSRNLRVDRRAADEPGYER